MKNRQKAPKLPEPQQNWFELEAERQETADVHPLEWMIGIVVAVIMGTSPDVNISTLGLFASVMLLLTFTGYYLRNRIVRSVTAAPRRVPSFLGAETVRSRLFRCS